MEGIATPQPQEGEPFCEPRCFTIAGLSRSISRGGKGLRPGSSDSEGVAGVEPPDPQRQARITVYLAAKATDYVPENPGACPWQDMCPRIPGSTIPFTGELKND